TIFIGKIGIDNFGDQMIQHLSDEGINTEYMIRTNEEHSGVAFIMIDENGENMISVAPGANATLNHSEIEQYSDIIKNASSIGVQMEIPTKTIKKIYEIASKGNAVKILNPAPLKPLPKSLFNYLDIIIPNQVELVRLHSLLGFEGNEDIKNVTTENVISMSKDIANLGTKYIITTLGSKGCIVYDSQKDQALNVPSFKVDAIDTVGAGDCFNGVLASQLSKGKNIIESVKIANCAASIAVTRKGAQASMPYQNEIMERVKKYKKLYQTTLIE
ncbi:MAG: ribokinase, partial [Promethearchaeota archaeon]